MRIARTSLWLLPHCTLIQSSPIEGVIANEQRPPGIRVAPETAGRHGTQACGAFVRLRLRRRDVSTYECASTDWSGFGGPVHAGNVRAWSAYAARARDGRGGGRGGPGLSLLNSVPRRVSACRGRERRTH